MAQSRLRTDRLLVVDLELTCWEGAPPAGEAPEIIEIGIAEIRTPDLEIGRSKRYLVRPRGSRVSAFCAQFTGLDEALLKREGRPYAEVASSIRREFGTPRKTWAAWGRDDCAIEAASHAARTPPPFSSSFIDFCHLWSLLSGEGALVSLEDALSAAGIEPQGQPHRALDDALNTARLWLEAARHWRDGLPSG